MPKNVTSQKIKSFLFAFNEFQKGNDIITKESSFNNYSIPFTSTTTTLYI